MAGARVAGGRLRTWAPRVLVAIALVLLGLTIWRRLSASTGPRPTLSAAAASTSTSSHVSSTSTTIQLENDTYRPGACVTWDQATERDDGLPRSTTVVPCSAPHLIEMTYPLDAKPEPGWAPTGPTDAQWQVWFQAHCAPLDTRYLGFSLDPHGRFEHAGLTPTSDSWRGGDHTVDCGIIVAAPNHGAAVLGRNSPFSGAVTRSDQAYLDAPGTCLADTGAVPCSEPHLTEVVGVTSYPGPSSDYPTTAQFETALQPACARLAAAYHRDALPSSVTTAWNTIATSSWAAGQRQTDCIIAVYPPSGGLPLKVTGSLAAGGVPLVSR